MQAYFPSENRVYNINRIFDVNSNEVKWESKQRRILTHVEFNNLLKSSILELQIDDPQKIPPVKNRGIVFEYEHFYLNTTTSQMFDDIDNYSIKYDTSTNSATFTINKRDGKTKKHGVYNINPVKLNSGQGGRPRRRSTFRQRKLKRTAAKSRRATRTRRV